MKYAVDSLQMKRIDDYTTGVHGTPALELMERAAGEVAARIIRNGSKSDRILAVCGSGNNGGDGVAAGRILYLQGYRVAILFIGDEMKCSEQMQIQLRQARNLGVPMENCDKLSEYNIIIDAIFGVGLSKPVTGVQEEVIRLINDNENTVYAIDIPSGISADDGRIRNIAVRADETVTFGHKKKGLLLYPGVEYAGLVTVADIGFPREATELVQPDTFYYEPEDLRRLPARRSYSHKGSYGKVLVIAGSRGMSGAAVLSAGAAYRSGAGLVKVLSSECNRLIVQTLVPEAIFSAYDDEKAEEADHQKRLIADLDWASVVILGPGIGRNDLSEKLVDSVVRNVKVPFIIDADALTILAGTLDQESGGEAGAGRLAALSELLPPQTILTPHLMELSRLLGVSLEEITGHFIDTARQCTYNNKLIYVMKDVRTVVAGEEKYYINISGNHGMATGGSGDALTGIIAALIAQGMKPYDAACLAVYVHGLAGDAAAREKGTYSMMAGDIVASIGKVLLPLDQTK